MAQEQREHRERVELFLAKLQNRYGGFVDPNAGYDLDMLAEGISGSSIYKLVLSRRPRRAPQRGPRIRSILKLTLPANGEIALGRAERELSFYRQLANRIPLRVPELLAAYDGPEGVALLMRAYQPVPSPERWQAAAYIEVARQLARLHSLFWGRGEELSDLKWLKRERSEQIEGDIESAAGYWQKLARQPRFAEILTVTDHKYRLLLDLLPRISQVRELFRSLPTTLCHGDSHIGNLLYDAQGAEGRLTWADWQEVGLARGPEDLSFFLQRALFAGANPPFEQMVAAYHEDLEAWTGTRISLAVIRQAVEAAELWSRVVYWPAYMTQASEEQLRHIMERIYLLAYNLRVAGEE